MDSKTIRLASPMQEDSFVDGPGVRMVIWTQGCRHHCPNCHNPQTWDTEGGTLYSVEQLQQQIRDAQLQSGLTLSGGEPFLQVEPLLEIVRTAKEKQLNIWAYSGFVVLVVLVDGNFLNDLKDYRLVFKGSRNQRIIDVQKSLQSGSVILSEKDEQNQKLKEEDMINA